MLRPNFSLRSLLLAVAFISAACATLRYPNGWLASGWWLGTLALLFFAVVAAVLRRDRPRAFWLGVAVCGWGYLWLSWFPATGAPFSSTTFPGTATPTLTRRLPTTRLLVLAYWAMNSSGWSNGEIGGDPFDPDSFSGAGGGFGGGGGFFGPTAVADIDVDDGQIRIAQLPVPEDGAAAVEFLKLPGVPNIVPPSGGFAPAGGSGTNSAVGATGPVPPAPTPLSMEEFVRLGNLFWTLSFALCGGIAGRWCYDTRQDASKT